MRKVLIILSIVTATLFSACGKKGIEKQQTNNANIEVTLMFEHDGCKLYRFYDYGEPVYYSTCKGSTKYAVVRDSTLIKKSVTTDEY